MKLTSFADAPIPNIEADYARKSDEELREIIEADRLIRRPGDCYASREGYQAIVQWNRRVWVDEIIAGRA
jgi:hypothetical protein